MQGNPSGGRTQGFAYTGSLGLDAQFDLEKLCGLCGLEGYAGFVWRGGVSLSESKIGNQFPVAQVFGGQTWRLDVLYLKQTLFCGRMHLIAGRIQSGDVFLQNPLYYNYVSNAFCGNPIGVFFNVFFTAYPNATWGAYADYKLTPKILVKAAVYNANPAVTKNSYHGFNFQFRNTQGTQYITEWSYLHNQGPCDSGLPGNYRAALYYYSAPYETFLGGPRRGNLGYYFLVDQMVYRRRCMSVHPFAALLFAPKDRNTFPFFFTSGFVFKGLMERRSQDVTALGVAYGSYSSDLRQQQRTDGEPLQNYEMVLEANHKFVVNKGFFVQPDLQYIIRPKGYSHIPNALVIGAQVGASF